MRLYPVEVGEGKLVRRLYSLWKKECEARELLLRSGRKNSLQSQRGLSHKKKIKPSYLSVCKHTELVFIGR